MERQIVGSYGYGGYPSYGMGYGGYPYHHGHCGYY